jgi:hypothetical protein
MALFGLAPLKDCPAQDAHTEMTIDVLFLTPGRDSFFEFREPRFLWGDARFGAEVATSDFKLAFA